MRWPLASRIAALALAACIPSCLRAGYEVPGGDVAPRDARVPAEARPADRLTCEMSGIVVPPTCNCQTADFNGDGYVGISDLAMLSTCIGKAPVGSCARCDTNQDGLVDCRDFACLALYYVKCPRPDVWRPG